MTEKSDAFIITKQDNGSYDLVGAEVLERYSIKADINEEGSKQLKTDGWVYDNALLEPLYDPYALCELLELNVYHENCVDVVARDSAGINYDIVPVTGEQDGSENDKKYLQDFFKGLTTNINKLLYKVNYDMRSTGYGVLEIIRESNAESFIENFSYIPSYTLRRTRDGKRAVQRVAEKEVWFVLYGKNYDDEGNLCDVHADTGEFYPYNSLSANEKANELLWFNEHNTKSEYYGLPKIIGAIPSMQGDLSRARYNNSFFKNYGMPAFALTVSGDFADYNVDPNDDDYDITQTLRYKISQQLKEVMKNPHSAVTILVPSEGEEGNVDINLQPLSVDTKEASFRLYRQDNRDEVIHAHRVPPYKVGVNETGSLGGSNIDTATVNYKNDVVLPIRGDNEEAINKLIINEFGINQWKFKIIEHDQRDYSIDLAILKELFNMACITPRQIIENIGDRFGLTVPKDNPFLDEYYLNGQPLDNVWGMDTNNNGLVSSEVNTILDNLEMDLMHDAEVLDDTITKESERQIGFDVPQSASIKEDNTSFTERISRAFNNRKTTE